MFAQIIQRAIWVQTLVLTATGQLAVSYADEIFQIGRELEETVRNRSGQGHILFRVGGGRRCPKVDGLSPARSGFG